MKNQVVNLIKETCKTFFITPKDQHKSYVVMVFPYVPYKLLNYKKYAQIDAYYEVSNSSYHKAKALASRLIESGVGAKYVFDVNYKKLALENNFAGVGKNTLTYLKNFGSRYVMQVLEIKGSYSHFEDDLKLNLDCENCNLCENACPTKAITKNGFDYTKCLRQLQEQQTYVTDDEADKLKNKLLGCDICQAVCPYNKHIKPIENPLKELVEFNNLFKVLTAKRQTREAFADLIGGNYARQKMLLNNLIITAGNSGNPDFKQKLEPFLNEKYGELVNKNAIRSIKKLSARQKRLKE